MKRGRHLLAWLYVFLLVDVSLAQSGLELAGFGMKSSTPGVISQGIGGIAAIPENPRSWLYSMPASWNNIRSTHLHAAIEATKSQLGDMGNYTRVGPQHFHFLLHLNRRTSYGFGIIPTTRVDMIVSKTDSVVVFEDTLRYSEHRGSVGGLSTFNMGFSRKILPSISIGAALNVVFGSLNQYDTLAFIGTTGRIDPATRFRTERRFEFNGGLLELSMLAAISPKRHGQIGLRAAYPLALKATESRVYPDRSTPVLLRHPNIGAPFSLVLGYGMDMAEKHRIMIEGGFTRLWKGENQDLIFGRHTTSTNVIRLAWSYTPRGDEILAFGRLYYRMGFYRQAYYLSALKNNPLAEVALTLGAGHQPPGFGHRIDFSIQIGQRDGLLPDVKSEKFFRVSFGVTTAELWFLRPKKKWD